MTHREILRNPKYKNWVKGALALKYLQTGLSEFAQQIAVTEHQEMINSTEIASGASCNVCEPKLIKPIHMSSNCPRGQKGCNCAHRNTMKCPNDICDTMYDEIMKQQGSDSVYWENSDIRKWTTDPWEVAKCYINAPGYENTHSAAETDVGGLLHLFINNKKFQDHVDCEISFIAKIRSLRNSVFHSPSLELEDQTLADGIAVIIAFLEDDKELRYDTRSKQSVLNLEELQRESFIITSGNELNVLQEAEEVIVKTCEPEAQRLRQEYEKLKLKQEQDSESSKEEIQEFKRKQEQQDAQIIQLQQTVKTLKERLVSIETGEHEQRTKMLKHLEESEKRLVSWITTVDREATGRFIDIRTNSRCVETMKEIQATKQAGECVCLKVFPTGSGTGFRVGVNKIMTAKHVVDRIESEISAAGIKEDTVQYAYLAAEGVEAIFGYYENYSYDKPLKFKFKPTVSFLDDELDVAVLELDESETEKFPCAFLKFSGPIDIPFKLIGYPTATRMLSNNDIRILDFRREMETINIARTISEKHVGRKFDCPPFNVVDNPKRVLFHCTFPQGASGSPGVIVDVNGHVSVVTMLLRGYPEWFYDTNVKQSMKDTWPMRFVVEQGVNMVSVFKEMEKRCPDLSREIFSASK